MINRNPIIPYKSNLIYNKVKYISDVDLYCTVHDAKVPFIILSFFSEETLLYITSKFINMKDTKELNMA